MSQHVMKIGGREYRAQVKELTSDRALVLVDGKEYAVELAHLGRKAPAPAEGVVRFASPVPTAPVPHARRSPTAAGDGAITAPMPGSIYQMKTREGDTVQAGQVLLVMEAMKMENPINAPYHGTVTKVFVREGDNVGEGDLLVEVARPEMTTL
jgi:glutaconyl-CoA/methylmalonyl-CoA decarboxylase subunit gamma